MASEHRLRRTAIGLFKILIAVVPLWWLATSGQLDFSILVRTQPSFLYILSFVLLLGYLVIQAMRWWRLIL